MVTRAMVGKDPGQGVGTAGVPITSAAAISASTWSDTARTHAGLVAYPGGPSTKESRPNLTCPDPLDRKEQNMGSYHRGNQMGGCQFRVCAAEAAENYDGA